MAQVQYQAVGRRKKAIARVRLVPGDGKVVVNRRIQCYRQNHICLPFRPPASVFLRAFCYFL